MALYDHTTDTVMAPNVKNKTHMVHATDDMTLETSQLMIRSPDDMEQRLPHNLPYKKVKYDPWSAQYLCTDPSGPLATVPLETLFDYSTFQLLPPGQQCELARLLPSPDTVDQGGNKTIPPSFFSRAENPEFWSALDDWQTMLANGEFASDAATVTEPMHDVFKDEAFEAYWGELGDRDRMHNVAGDSKNITLKDMCRKGLIRENDVIVYKRNFSACKVIVSKSMTVVKASGATGISIELNGEIFQDFETPTALETKILDQHGKVTKDKRPNGNAFKSIRLIRDGKDLGRLFDIRKDGFGDAN